MRSGASYNTIPSKGGSAIFTNSHTVLCIECMAMYVEFKNGSESVYHVGSQKKIPSPREVVSIQADGDELEKIQLTMTLSRISSKRVVTWVGDDAQFIAANWCH